jgi:hypothetical protein
MKQSLVRPFQVLKNQRTGELGLVIEIADGKVVMANRDGVRSLYKLTPDFIKIVDTEGFSLAALAGMRLQAKAAAEQAKMVSSAKRKATRAAKKAAGPVAA